MNRKTSGIGFFRNIMHDSRCVDWKVYTSDTRNVR